MPPRCPFSTSFLTVSLLCSILFFSPLFLFPFLSSSLFPFSLFILLSPSFLFSYTHYPFLPILISHFLLLSPHFFSSLFSLFFSFSFFFFVSRCLLASSLLLSSPSLSLIFVSCPFLSPVLVSPPVASLLLVSSALLS